MAMTSSWRKWLLALVGGAAALWLTYLLLPADPRIAGARSPEELIAAACSMEGGSRFVFDAAAERFGSREACETLRDILRNGKDHEVRRCAAWTLGRCSECDPGEALTAALKDEETGAAAADALKQLARP